VHKIFIAVFVTLFTFGCIPRTKTEIPAFSGAVVDSESGLPLAGVTINEEADHAPAGWVPRTMVTAMDGRFSYPAVTSGTVFQLPAPGAGWPVTRTLTFHKDGYRDVTCSCTNLSLFGKDNRADIPLPSSNHSEPANGQAPLIRLTDAIGCQAFVGSRVEYEGTAYLIGKIYEQSEPGYVRQMFSLWPIPPNEGEVVMDVPVNDVRLNAPKH